jgi:plasmid maintenance system antidote protein VapI
MVLTFEILGVSPVLHFFNYQQKILYQKPQSGVAYLGSYKCTLDALLESVETVTPSRGWQLDQVVDSVMSFWMNNIESIRHWKNRLEDAGSENLLVSRLADIQSLQSEFEWLLKQ